jgi:beta-phosphoglucomutase-like phosphatase (HAD superfamily)
VGPELPYLAAGTIAIIGGIRKEGHFPSNGVTAVVGTTVLVIVASATAETRIAPLVHAFGLLVLLTAIIAATQQWQAKPKPKPTK